MPFTAGARMPRLEDGLTLEALFVFAAFAPGLHIGLGPGLLIRGCVIAAYPFLNAARCTCCERGQQLPMRRVKRPSSVVSRVHAGRGREAAPLLLQLRRDQHLDRAGVEQSEHAEPCDHGNHEPYHYGAAQVGLVVTVLTHIRRTPRSGRKVPRDSGQFRNRRLDRSRPRFASGPGPQFRPCPNWNTGAGGSRGRGQTRGRRAGGGGGSGQECDTRRGESRRLGSGADRECDRGSSLQSSARSPGSGGARSEHERPASVHLCGGATDRLGDHRRAVGAGGLKLQEFCFSVARRGAPSRGKLERSRQRWRVGDVCDRRAHRRAGGAASRYVHAACEIRGAIIAREDHGRGIASTEPGIWFAVHRVDGTWKLVLEQEPQQCREGQR
jgi:hypothetical protein